MRGAWGGVGEGEGKVGEMCLTGVGWVKYKVDERCFIGVLWGKWLRCLLWL